MEDKAKKKKISIENPPNLKLVFKKKITLNLFKNLKQAKGYLRRAFKMICNMLCMKGAQRGNI